MIGFDERPKGRNPLAKKRSPTNATNNTNQASRHQKSKSSFTLGNKLGLKKLASREGSYTRAEDAGSKSYTPKALLGKVNAQGGS